MLLTSDRICVIFMMLNLINNPILSVVPADGVALGAAASTSQTSVQLIVFVAIMLHKVQFYIIFLWIKFTLVINCLRCFLFELICLEIPAEWLNLNVCLNTYFQIFKIWNKVYIFLNILNERSKKINRYMIDSICTHIILFYFLHLCHYFPMSCFLKLIELIDVSDVFFIL